MSARMRDKLDAAATATNGGHAMKRHITKRGDDAVEVSVDPADYGGSTITLVPLLADAATQEEAAQTLDAVVAEITALLEHHPKVRLATRMSDTHALLEALQVCHKINVDTYQAWARRQADGN